MKKQIKNETESYYLKFLVINIVHLKTIPYH